MMELVGFGMQGIRNQVHGYMSQSLLILSLVSLSFLRAII